MAALAVERMEIGTIRPHPQNPRRHPKPGSAGWETLRRSLEHDYFDPLVLNKRNGFLVSGHLRHKVLLAAGFSQVDVSIVDYDEPTHLARMIAANSLVGQFDDAILTELARELQTEGVAPGLAGWTEDDLAQHVGEPGGQDDTATAVVMASKAGELQGKWQVKSGDLFQVGRHRLLCGDCTRPENWLRLLEGQSVDLIWTDPPYNVDYDPEPTSGNEGDRKILNDNLSPEQYRALLDGAFAMAYAVARPGAGIYVAHADSEGLANRAAVQGAGWHLSQCLIWVKSGFTLGRQDYQWQHEPILYGWKPGAGHFWQGGYNRSTVLDDEKVDLRKSSKEDLIAIVQRLRNDRNTTVVREAKPVANVLHPTIKPLPLVARQIWTSSREGDVVGDMFGGSGTTLFAAEQTGRRAVLTEQDPKYAAVILERASERGLPIERLAHAPD